MKVELLVDITDTYYNVFYKKGQIVNIIINHPATSFLTDTVLLKVHGYGAYTYATKGQWKYIN